MSIYRKISGATSALVLGLAMAHTTLAQDYNEQPTPEELAKLGLEGTELTPAGAIRAVQKEPEECIRAAWAQQTLHLQEEPETCLQPRVFPPMRPVWSDVQWEVHVDTTPCKPSERVIAMKASVVPATTVAWKWPGT